MNIYLFEEIININNILFSPSNARAKISNMNNNYGNMTDPIYFDSKYS